MEVAEIEYSVLVLITLSYFFYIYYICSPRICPQDSQKVMSIFINRLRRRINSTMRIPVRMLNFVERTIPNFNDTEFQSHFRITRTTFDRLLNTIGMRLESRSGRNTLDPSKQLLSVLWLLATPDSYRSVGLRFNMGKSSLSHCFMRVIRALNELAPKVIKWPQREYRREVIEGFSRLAGIREVIGAIDGTYIPIKAPSVNAQSYINRKCFYGITLQAICDHKRKFTDCFIGYPSSVSDIRIFRNSDIYENILLNQASFFDAGQFIIGDKAYCIKNWCIPPFIDRGLRNVQVHFNTLHAKTRQVIERSFALLFGRFRRLRYLDMNRTDLIPSTVIAACVLHNICLENPDELLNVFENEGMDFVAGEHNLAVNYRDNNLDENVAYDIRNRIAEDLYNRRH